VRALAAVLWLQRAGVRVFDAGTTAGYFVDLFGYRRTTKAEFLALWRAHRDRALAEPTTLSQECGDVRSLLRSAQAAASSSVTEGAGKAAARRQQRSAKPSVRVDGLPPGTTEAELVAVFESGCTGCAVRKATVVRQQ
jgi:hypothetical protein